MNFYNPYFYSLPGMSSPGIGTLGRLASSTRGLSLGSIISGTQKTLNIINQAIPIIKEASPMMRNAKTMFKIANEFKKVDTPNVQPTENISNIAEQTENNSQTTISESGPTFFL